MEDARQAKREKVEGVTENLREKVEGVTKNLRENGGCKAEN